MLRHDDDLSQNWAATPHGEISVLQPEKVVNTSVYTQSGDPFANFGPGV